MQVAARAANAQMLMAVLAFSCLAVSFIENDFTLINVATNSNSRLPVAYRFAATWGSHEGSMLLWSLMLACWTAAVVNFGASLDAVVRSRVIGVLDKVHDRLFAALNVDRRKLDTEDELAAFFAEQGVKEQDFRKAFSSFGVENSVKQADARARSYRITGTPELVVNGKYRISAKTAGSPEAMLKVVDFLVAQERAARPKSSP